MQQKLCKLFNRKTKTKQRCSTLNQAYQSVCWLNRWFDVSWHKTFNLSTCIRNSSLCYICSQESTCSPNNELFSTVFSSCFPSDWSFITMPCYLIKRKEERTSPVQRWITDSTWRVVLWAGWEWNCSMQLMLTAVSL